MPVSPHILKRMLRRSSSNLCLEQVLRCAPVHPLLRSLRPWISEINLTTSLPSLQQLDPKISPNRILPSCSIQQLVFLDPLGCLFSAAIHSLGFWADPLHVPPNEARDHITTR